VARAPVRRDVLLVAAAALAFSTSGPLGKVAAAIPAVTIACGRTGGAAAVLFLSSPRSVLGALRGLSGKQRAGVAFAGALLAAHFALFLGGLAATSLAAAVSLVSLEPLAVVVAAFVAFRIRPSALELVGLLVATGGALVVASGSGVGEHRLSGDLMVLGAVALFGAYVMSARGLRDALPGVPYVAAVYGTSSVILLPLVAFAGVGHPDAPAALAVVGLALVPTLIGHTLMQLAARRAPPALVALVSPGETLGSLAIGALFMGAAPSTREALGAALVLAGATLAVVRPRAERTDD
jgi:drug/metabolite transporter (DMT)-like permease